MVDARPTRSEDAAAETALQVEAYEAAMRGEVIIHAFFSPEGSMLKEIVVPVDDPLSDEQIAEEARAYGADPPLQHQQLSTNDAMLAATALRAQS